MKRSVICFLTFFLCLNMISACFSVGEVGNEPIEMLISSVIQSSYPDCHLFDYAPIGQEKTEYIVLAVDSGEKPAVMIVNTEQPFTGVEFCNYRILEGIPLDRNNLQVMDHLADGNPYLWYTNTESPDLLYVVFRKNDDGQWLVNEAQFGDDWCELYWFQYSDEDQQLHFFLSGNDLTVTSDDVIDRNAESFYPIYVRQYMRDMLEPYAEGKDEKEKESIKGLMHIQSDDEIISYTLSDDSSFAAVIIRSETESGLSFYILEKDNNGWKISACNKSGMLREFDPLYLPRLGTGPNGSEEQPENEIYIQYESAESTGWDESVTIKKDVSGWNVSEYAFFILEDHPYCPFWLFVINDPIDPEFNCLAQCSYCLKNCSFDVSISSFNRSELRNGITNMFNYDAIEAWITRNPDIENYSNYYDWARNR